MSIIKKDVEHIAHLTRIELSDEEKQKFEKELSGILAFVEKLNSVPTGDVLPMTGGTDLENETREDGKRTKEFDAKQENLIGQIPEKKDSWVRVKAVFE